MERKLDLAGTTGWQVYENIDSETEAILNSELIVTLETDRDWLDTDAPTWFLAIPSDLDDPDGVRDYIIIKGRYLRVEDSTTSKIKQRQEIEYYQMQDPTF